MSNKNTSELKKYMSATHRHALGELPTTHENCIEKTGVARPGKTAKERAKREARQEQNK